MGKIVQNIRVEMTVTDIDLEIAAFRAFVSNFVKDVPVNSHVVLGDIVVSE